MHVNNLDILVAPKTHKQLKQSTEGDLTDNDQRFPFRNGILYLLPEGIENQEIKEREREGWKQVFENHKWSTTGEEILSLPESFDLPYWRKANAAFKMALAALEPLQGKCGLDVACGLGWGATNFARRGARMIAADFNDTLHNGLGAAIQVRTHGIDFDAVCCDCEYLPIASSSLDFVFICSALHHFTRPEVALTEIFRVLKPEGIFIDICEAFHTGMGDKEREESHEELIEFRAAGINEQAFTHREYLAMYTRTGFRVQTLLPDWDKVVPGRPVAEWENGDLDRVAKEHHSAPMRLILKLRRFAPLLKFLRWRRLNYTVADRIFICTKP